MNTNIALLTLVALTGSVAFADEVRAIHPGLRGDGPAGSVLPDNDASKKTPPKEDVAEKSHLKNLHFVPEEDALDEDSRSEIGGEVGIPGHRGIYNALYPTSNEDPLQSKDGSPDEESASKIDLAESDSSDNLCAGMKQRCLDTLNWYPQNCNKVENLCYIEVASRKFIRFGRGGCLDKRDKFYPILNFKYLSIDQCKAKCYSIKDAKVQGIGMMKVDGFDAGNCNCLLDFLYFESCKHYFSLYPNDRCLDTSSRSGALRKGSGSVQKTSNDADYTCYKAI